MHLAENYYTLAYIKAATTETIIIKIRLQSSLADRLALGTTITTKTATITTEAFSIGPRTYSQSHQMHLFVLVNSKQLEVLVILSKTFNFPLFLGLIRC